MKVFFMKDEIWPDYIPVEEGNRYAQASAEMTKEELEGYNLSRDMYFEWLRKIRGRIEE